MGGGCLSDGSAAVCNSRSFKVRRPVVPCLWIQNSYSYSLEETDHVIWLQEVDRRSVLLGDLCNWVNEGIF